MLNLLLYKKKCEALGALPLYLSMVKTHRSPFPLHNFGGCPLADFSVVKSNTFSKNSEYLA